MNYEELYNSIQAYTENTEQLFVANIPVFLQEAELRIYNSVNVPSLRKNVTGSMNTGNQYVALPLDWLANYSIAVIDPTTGMYNYLINKDVNFLRQAYPFASNNGITYQGTPTGTPKYYSLFGSQFNDVNEMTIMVAPAPDQNYPIEMHYYYYPPTIVKGQITTLGSLVGGAGYTNGVYQNVALTGGSGANATADIVVSGGVVTQVTISFGGNFYVVGDTLSSSSIGSSNTPFSISVLGVSNATGTSWLGDNYDAVLFYGAMREAMLFMKQEQDLVTEYEQKYQEALVEFRRFCDGLDRGDAYRDGQTKLNINLKGNVVS
jgi:hypothetical protein